MEWLLNFKIGRANLCLTIMGDWNSSESSHSSRVWELAHCSKSSTAMTLGDGQGHGHGHGIFILETHPEGKWTTNPNPLLPSIPAQTQQRAQVSAAWSPPIDSRNHCDLREKATFVKVYHDSPNIFLVTRFRSSPLSLVFWTKNFHCGFGCVTVTTVYFLSSTYDSRTE